VLIQDRAFFFKNSAIKNKKPANDQGLFQTIDYHSFAEAPDDEYPFWLTTGIIFTHYLTSTMTRRCSTLNLENLGVFIEIRDSRFKKILFVLEKSLF